MVADLFSVQAECAISSVVQELNSQETGGTHTLPPGETTELTSEQKTKLASHFCFREDADAAWKANSVHRLLGYVDAFSQAEFDIGEVDFEHDIELDPGPCIRDRPRPVPPQDVEELRQHIQPSPRCQHH